MSVERETILKWLNEENRDREWLAKECGVDPPALSNWLRETNPRPIPSKAVVIISNLMAIDSARKESLSRTPQNLVLDFTQEEFDDICRAAAKETQIPRVWAKSWLNGLAHLSPSALEALANEISHAAGSSLTIHPLEVEQGKSSASSQG